MSGRALIFTVLGIIMASSLILYNISASSTRIVENVNGYYLRQTGRNIAQSGVNISLNQLGLDRTWRAGFLLKDMFGGKVSVRVWDTTYGGITSAVGIKSTGYVQYGLPLQQSYTSTAYAYFPAYYVPSNIKGLIMMRAPNSINGNITIDGRDHDLSGNVIADSGMYGIWSTGSSFTVGGSGAVGGTVSNVDYVPTGILPNPTIALNQTFPAPGYPGTPDSVFGGASAGFTDGTLKAIAKTGVSGSQYVTDPTQLHYPLQGVTYVEMPTGSPTWSSANISGSGILIVHNSAKTAQLSNTAASFTGIVISDDIYHLHGNVNGVIITLTSSPAGGVMGNGSSVITFSRMAIKNSISLLVNGTQLKVIAWWE